MIILKSYIPNICYSFALLCSVPRLCPTLCDPMDCSMSGFPVFHCLPKSAQTPVHWVNDAVQPSHPQSPHLHSLTDFDSFTLSHSQCFPGSSVGKESTGNAGDPGSIPGLGRSAGKGRGYSLQSSRASLVAQLVKNPPAMQATWVRSLGWEDLLEKGVSLNVRHCDKQKGKWDGLCMQLKDHGEYWAMTWKIQKDTGTSAPATVSFSSSWLSGSWFRGSHRANLHPLPQGRQHPLTGLWGNTKTFPLCMKIPKGHPKEDRAPDHYLCCNYSCQTLLPSFF